MQIFSTSYTRRRAQESRASRRRRLYYVVARAAEDQRCRSAEQWQHAANLCACTLPCKRTS
jgi:hypothetical protein